MIQKKSRQIKTILFIALLFISCETNPLIDNTLNNNNLSLNKTAVSNFDIYLKNSSVAVFTWEEDQIKQYIKLTVDAEWDKQEFTQKRFVKLKTYLKIEAINGNGDWLFSYMFFVYNNDPYNLTITLNKSVRAYPGMDIIIYTRFYQGFMSGAVFTKNNCRLVGVPGF